MKSIVAAAIVAAALASCSSESDRPAAPRAPSSMPVVTITLRDHRFELDRDVPSGRVLFRVINAGQARHQVTMVPLPEDLPPILEQLRGTQRRYLEPFAGVYERKPGDTGTFAVDLFPGQRYALICSIKDEDDRPHWMKGMASEFRTPGRLTVTTQPPAPNETAPPSATG